MKWFYILLFCFTLPRSLKAQDNWTVEFNGKSLLKATGEDPEKHKLQISPTDLRRKQTLKIVYREEPPRPDWQRSFLLFDPNDNELCKKTADGLTLKNATLAGLFRKSGIIHVYTLSIPKDPQVAATVRVRRVHICTLILTDSQD